MVRMGDMVLKFIAAWGVTIAVGCATAGAVERHAPPRRDAGMSMAAGQATDFSAQRRYRRPPTRIRVHPRSGLTPDSVRDCTATYVQEFRPSGTVIVPRMHCFWRRG